MVFAFECIQLDAWRVLHRVGGWEDCCQSSWALGNRQSGWHLSEGHRMPSKGTINE